MLNSNLKLQKILLHFNFNEGSGIASTDFQLKHVRPVPFKHENDHVLIMVFGTPIIGSVINPKYIVNKILSNSLSNSTLKYINGEFLIVIFEKDKKKVSIINDRFTSFPVYYAAFDNEFVASFSYYDLWQWLKKNNRLNFSKESFSQLIFLRRLFGEDTHDTASSFLMPASRLEFSHNHLKIEKYWEPSYIKRRLSLSEWRDNLEECIKTSILRKTSDDKRYGLFLSGGMDTRVVLSGFPFPPTCFTATTNTEGNREYTMANRAAKTKGSEHIHLSLNTDHYENIYDTSVKQAGAMYFPNGIFMGYADIVSQKADVLFHGHGFDYMFQGMYVPSSYYHLFSRNLRARHIRKLDSDLASEYINTVSYRSKYKGLTDCFIQSRQNYARDSLYEKIKSIVSKGFSYTDNVYDVWRYLSFHALSRHYSYPDHAGIHLNGEQRTITFDNDLYDLYLSMPVEYQFDGKVLRSALRKMNPRLAKIPNANDGYLFVSSKRKTMYQLRDAALVRCKLKRREISSHMQRTWPSYEWMIKEIDTFRNMALSLSENSPVAQIEFLDMKKISSLIHRALSGHGEIAQDRYFYDFVWNLMGVNRFFEL